MIDKPERTTQAVKLRQNAWHGDDQVQLSFPGAWQVQLIQAEELPKLTPEQLLSSLNAPIGSKGLKDICSNSKKPVILVDDLTRPTPIASVLPLILAELNNAGIKNSSITILIACGTHEGITVEDINKKLGGKVPEEIRVITHECHKCELLGYTSTKTPIQTNPYILESDLKIGIGGIYPHPIAGFSGGGKLLVLGAGGYDTIRVLHDQKSGSRGRDGSIEHEFRREVNEITRMIGYDFSINLVLNADREVAALFCGDPEKAFQTGVKFYNQHFSVNIHENADIVISDMYPFDTDFQYAFDRGLWPFLNCRKRTVKIILASSPQGISNHPLFPVRNPLITRLVRRMKHFHVRDLMQLKQRVNSLLNVIKRRNLELYVVSQSINKQDLQRVLPLSMRIDSWSEMEGLIYQRFGWNSNIKVAIYKTAPLLMIPRQED